MEEEEEEEKEAAVGEGGWEKEFAGEECKVRFRPE